MREAALINESRGKITECIHSGHISIVNDRGETIFFAGNPDFYTYTRSSAKPFQAIPGVRAGIMSYYQLTGEELAIMTSSHRSEEIHSRVLEQLSLNIHLGEEDLSCAPSLPLDEAAMEELLRSGGQRRRIFHNCSGKHLGVLAYSQMMGYSLKGYDHPDHPVQIEILDTFASFTELPKDQIQVGIDGCGFPVYAVPLSALAKAYMKLACPDRIDDTPTRNAAIQITKAMNDHPNLIGGGDRVDSILLQDDNIVSKGGFKGVFCFSLKKERIGVALKIIDGSEEEWGLIVLHILEQLNYSNTATIDNLKRAFSPDIYNDEGLKVGRSEAVFKLTGINQAAN